MAPHLCPESRVRVEDPGWATWLGERVMVAVKAGLPNLNRVKAREVRVRVTPVIRLKHTGASAGPSSRRHLRIRIRIRVAVMLATMWKGRGTG